MQIVSKFAAKLDMGGKRWSGWSKTVSQDALLRLHPWCFEFIPVQLEARISVDAEGTVSRFVTLEKGYYLVQL